jgi:Undecaprenyl-phosphate glucose phosphotransferase
VWDTDCSEVPTPVTRRSINLIQFWLTIGYFSIPGVAFSIAGYIRFRSGLFAAAEVDTHSYVIFTVLVSLLWALVIQHFRLNRIVTLLMLHTGVKMAALATLYCTLLSLSASFFYRTIDFARIFVLVGCSLLFVLSFCLIHFFRGAMHAIEKSRNGRFPVAILGADEFAADIACHLSNSQMAHCKVACFVALPNQVVTILDSPVLEWERLDDVVDVFRCAEIFVALPPHRFGEAQKILKTVQHLCIPARMILDLGEGVFVPERIFDYYGIPLLDVRPYPVDTVGYALGKRVFDVLFSLIVLLVAAPFLLAIALAIKLSSRGPVFFVQERVSLNGRRFRMLKFRTMYLQDLRGSDSLHTSREDQRITPVGRFLRRTSLDELPQFINVLNGEMSVVGPRPELTFFVQKFRQEIPWYMARHNVKCGITGWAQVNGLRGSDTSIPNRIQHDLYYMRNWSMTLDLKIIFLTVFNGFVSPQAY